MSGIRHALCCAPPLSDELLADYDTRIALLEAGPVQDAVRLLWRAARVGQLAEGSPEWTWEGGRVDRRPKKVA